jgi:hypothetical protein
MKWPLLFPYFLMVLAAVVFVLTPERAIAADTDKPARAGVASGRGVPEALPTGEALTDSHAGKRPDELHTTALDSKVQRGAVDQEEMERRNRLFILMLQILRAPK